jgi:uncharacterized RDD family membrane protein YckC
MVAQRRGAASPAPEQQSAPGQNQPAVDGSSPDQSFPGERYGLPESGPGSVAGLGRRLGALAIDWAVCTVIAVAAFRSQFWTLAVFAVEVWLLTALTGFTIGKRLVGIRVARLDGRPVGFGCSVLRLLVFLLVVPPLVYDRDVRGLHDRAANTVVIRT